MTRAHTPLREYGSTLYAGLVRAVPPTNTNFHPLLLPTQGGKYRTSNFKSTLTFIGPASAGSPLQIFSSISSEDIPPRSACKCFQNLNQLVAIHLKYVLWYSYYIY